VAEEEIHSTEASSQETRRAPHEELQEPAREGLSVNLDLILDLPVTVSIELGRTRLQVEDILRLGQGSVVELKKLAGEPLEILVQGRPIGKGEVVVVNDKYGIRLTDIISPVERIQRLR
jgi:flagellar motor switch protein FliN/FliY